MPLRAVAVGDGGHDVAELRVARQLGQLVLDVGRRPPTALHKHNQRAAGQRRAFHGPGHQQCQRQILPGGGGIHHVRNHAGLAA